MNYPAPANWSTWPTLAPTTLGANRREIITSAIDASAFPLVYLALGDLPALFALPAVPGDIAAGIAASLVARRLAQG
jgi:hypothetical protein